MDNLEKIKKVASENKGKPKQLLATPSNVRVASSTIERVRRLLVTFIYALFVGLGVYHIQSFAITNGAPLADSSALFYKAAAFVFAILLVATNAYYIYYSAKVQNKTTWWRTARHLINGFIPLMAVVLLAVGAIGKPTDIQLLNGDGSGVSAGTNIFIYIVAIGIVGSAAWTFIENVLQRKKFPNAFKISRNLLPGILITLVGFIILSTKTSNNVVSWSDLIVPGLIFFAGAAMVFFASALSFRSSDYGNKLKKLIKYGYVAHLVVTFTILTCFLFSKANLSLLSKDTSGMIILVLQVLATIMMITFIIWTTRLKRNLVSNPIHNRIMLMAYLGFVNVLGLLAIFTSPNALTTIADKSEFSFTFLGLSSLLSLLVVLVAGAMSFMTVEFKGFTALAMAALQLVLILFLTMVIFTEKDVAVITNLMGRFVVLLIYATTFVIYLLFESYWIIHLFLGEKSDKKELKRAEEARIAKELQEEGQNA